MFKSLVAAAALIAGSFVFASKAKAEVYTCIFTEPFVTVTYDNVTEVLSVSPVGESVRVQKGVLFRPHPMTGEINLVNSKGVTLFTLTNTGTGSDGMSDYVYPFEAVVKSSQEIPVGYFGGCDSTSQPRVER